MRADTLVGEKVGLLVYAKAELSAADSELGKVGCWVDTMVGVLVVHLA